MLETKKSFLIFLFSGLLLQAVFNACSSEPFAAQKIDSVGSENFSHNQNQTSDGSSNGDQGNGAPDSDGSSSTGNSGNDPVVINPGDSTGGDTSGGSNSGGTNSGGGNPGGGNSLIPAFVAVGHWGSSMVSCDGGHSWVGYRSLDNEFRCWSNSHGNVDCDHHPSSAKGVTYGDLGFIATFGWGQPGQVEMSTDGSQWTVVQQGNTWAGVAFGNGVYVLNDRQPLLSQNLSNWVQGGYQNFTPWNARRIDFVNQGGGLFISQAQSGAKDIMISTDNGMSFHHPQTRPADCGNGSLAYSSSAILIFSGSLCVSTDQGENWVTPSNYPQGISNVLYDGVEFKAYGMGKVYRSTNGLNWTEVNLRLNDTLVSNLNFQHVEYHSGNSKYVALWQGWQQWYESTRYFVSDDGISWVELNKNQSQVPQAPHPITTISAGYVTDCP